MLTIGIFLITVIIVAIYYYRTERRAFPYIITILVILFAFVAPMLCIIPFAGYHEEPIIEDTDLLPIVEGKDTAYYLIHTEDYLYTFRTTETLNEYGVLESELKTLSGTNVKYFEEENTINGILRKYTILPKRNLFTLALKAEEVEYVILVPKGSVIK